MRARASPTAKGLRAGLAAATLACGVARATKSTSGDPLWRWARPCPRYLWGCGPTWLFRWTSSRPTPRPASASGSRDEQRLQCFVDYKVSFNNQELTRILGKLKDEIRRAYAEFTGKPQEEYWVVAHHIVR